MRCGAGVIALAVLVGCSAAEAPTPADRLAAADPRALAVLEQLQVEDSPDERLGLADRLVEVAPDLPDGWFHRGLVLLRLYQLEAADSAFARAAALDPFHRGAWFQRGHVAFEEGEYEEAIARYERQRSVIERSPDNLRAFYADVDPTATAQTWLQEGRSYQLLHDADRAIVAFGKALALDSTHAQAHFWLSEVLESRGELQAALDHARIAAESGGGDPGFVYRYGVLLFESGRFDDAIGPLEYVAQRQPWNAGVHFNLGRIYSAIGDSERGEAHLSRTDFLQNLDQEIDQARAAASRFPNDPGRWRALADLLGTAGRDDERLETLAVATAVERRGGMDP